MINLLFCGNSGVFDGILTCVLSILKRSKLVEPLNIYIYTMDVSRIDSKYVPISDEQIKFLEDEIKKYNLKNKINKIDVTDYYEREFGGCPNEGAYCSPYTLLRLFADEIEGMPDKILYLDADLLFNRDINLLYSIDVTDYEYAASRDHYGKFLINPNYINAGVILFNLKKSKETGLLTKARKLIQTKKLLFADQSAIIRSTTKKKVLSQIFNNQKNMKKDTVVRHFSKRLFYLPYPHTDNIKQWHVDKVHKVFKYHQFDDILDEYLRLKNIFDNQKGN